MPTARLVALAPSAASAHGAVKKFGPAGRLTAESACPTLLSKDFRASGAGASACQPILSQLLTRRATFLSPLSGLALLSLMGVRRCCSLANQ